MTFPHASLPDNLAAFCDTLRRDHRFNIGPRELQDAALALEVITIADERAVRNALRAVLSGSRDDVCVFDRAFDVFFLGHRGAITDVENRGSPTADHAAASRPRGSAGTRVEHSGDAHAEAMEAKDGIAAVPDASEGAAESALGLLRLSYSPLEAEGPAVALEPPDEAWRTAAAALVSRVHLGLSRRWRPAPRGRRFDLRRTLRTSLHTSGDVVTPRWRAHPRRRPRFVVLIDGSRSMESATRPALQAAVALTAVAPQTETFTFSTALCRLTPDVRLAVAGERRRRQLHHAWGGGTLIGVCLDEFGRRFGQRLLGRNTIVLIASDGLDVGDADLLRQAMAQLSRRSAGVVWINPLVETPGYEPTALGMSVARPFVSLLASVNDPAGLASLSRRVRVR